MQTFFFDMIDGVSLRDRTGVEFDSSVEAIEHRDDKDLEISVVNALGREIHREFVHRESAADAAIKK